MGERVSFPPDGSVLHEVRAKVRSLAANLGAEPRICDNLALVVDELVNNAIEHGVAYRQSRTDLAVRLLAEGERLALEFFDPEMPVDAVDELAQALVATANGMPSLESERGRGLFLLTVYLEELRAEAAPQGGLRLVGFVLRK